MNSRKDNGGLVGRKSFVNVVTSNDKVGSGESSDGPVIVLDDECLISKDLSNTLMGRVKEFESLTNLKTTLSNEGFVDIRIRYMGELWVMVEFDSSKSKDSFRDNVGVNSWFSEIKQADVEFTPNGRIVWVEIEGIPFKFWSGNTFKKVAVKWGELLDVDDKDESCFHSKRLCIYTKYHKNIFDNFKVIFRGKAFWVRAKEVPGWVPDLLDVSDDEDDADDGYMGGDNKNQETGSMDENSDAAEVPETIFDDSIGPKENKSEDPFGIYSLLNKKAKDINAGSSINKQSLKYPPGFTPNSEEGVGSGQNEVHDGCDVNRDNKGSMDVGSQSGSNGRIKMSE
ncbi:RNA-directed DNA polymerase, eukaryota, reverse transcriptase zinc-binding domain protein, partial [Tanacetum coccineum]